MTQSVQISPTDTKYLGLAQDTWKPWVCRNHFMHLTQDFYCLPHNLLLGKFRAYGLSETSCSLINNYLSTEWADIIEKNKALFWAFFFSMFLFMIYFTFWIRPLSTTVLTTTPFMLIQTLTLSFTLATRLYFYTTFDQ